MRKVLILSGAGLSAESGLRTFRDSDGLWEEYDIKEVCSARGLRENRQKVLDFYDKRRAQLAECEPNEAHRMIARIKAKYSEQIAVLMQNVDDLLERAGCMDVVHLHGFLPEIYCQNCKKIEYIGYEAINAREHVCKCGCKKFRHNIVMFGEAAPFYATLYHELEDLRYAEDSLFVCIGTSGQVLNVAGYAKYAKKSILNNLEKSDIDYAFSKCYIEKATAAAAKIEADIEKFFS
ncbi:MAG: NAD-dependent deacetylase [Campylobacter sp.]|uniref:SIR2 family NAD-dependent protein deacylase n=1 Tax=Campylobacter sp. TaxID=205 RepID=UPI002A7F7685|nr:NAD-dependent deacetylase [Campylobacter sp.]MCI7586355.1 NAD-dependent deacetylase [Campylobacter sp.]MDY3776118.1 NAD-dependent deacetylase [Campylobacter sp.]MDY5114465.1 NAD-dependent deacetylase [Campylobacter sp.]